MRIKRFKNSYRPIGLNIPRYVKINDKKRLNLKFHIIYDPANKTMNDWTTLIRIGDFMLSYRHTQNNEVVALMAEGETKDGYHSYGLGKQNVKNLCNGFFLSITDMNIIAYDAMTGLEVDRTYVKDIIPSKGWLHCPECVGRETKTILFEVKSVKL